MIHYLTENEFDKLWPHSNPNPLFDTLEGRTNYWENVLTPKFKLIYTESPNYRDPDFLGSIEGSSHHITIFLLQL